MKSFWQLPLSTQRLLGIGITLALFLALPLFVWAIITQRFELRRYASGEVTPSPLSTTVPSPATYNMRVLVIKYFPLTASGQNIDVSVTGDVGDSYPLIKQRTVDVTNNLITKLSQASKYKGYGSTSAPPSLSFQVVNTYEYTQAVPMLTDGTRRPNYNSILSQHNICDWVESQGVREVWLWAYQGPAYPGSQNPYLAISESKMAGPFGDISNSNHENDMPTCQNSYRVYTYNFGRGTAEAMESWGHQMEAELDVVDQNGIFRSKFQGPNYPQTLGVNGRCGSVHNPPNARSEYDRGNPIPQKSDCLNWRPDSLGTLSDISCQNWGCADGGDSNNPHLNYQVWNWQNLPGLNNSITYQGSRLRNWWDIHGDFDNVMANSRTLLGGSLPTLTPTSTASPTPVSTATATATATASASPSILKVVLKLKFAGVEDASAEGAKITVRFVSGTTDYVTPPISVSHIGNGVYQEIFAIQNPSLQLSTSFKYSIIVKGEKHVGRKFCQSSGQTARCVGAGNITIPSGAGTLDLDFTGISLEPGDVFPQDGKADATDFAKIKSALGKLCSQLTDEEKLSSDLDYSGCATVKDAFLLRKTLETRYDEE